MYYIILYYVIICVVIICKYRHKAQPFATMPTNKTIPLHILSRSRQNNTMPKRRVETTHQTRQQPPQRQFEPTECIYELNCI